MAETMAILSNLSKPAISLADLLKDHFSYFWRIESRIRRLTTAIGEVEAARYDLQRRVDAAKRSGGEIMATVENWLETAEKTDSIRAELVDAPIPFILNLKPRYLRGKRVKKTTESMDKLVEVSRNFNLISTLPHPGAMTPIHPPLGKHFASRQKTEDAIIKVMQGMETNLIGLCGMGGVGKTNMAELVINRVQNLYDEIIKVVSGHGADLSTIQKDICQALCLKFYQVDRLDVRNRRLKTRLSNGRKFLIVIDDVWEEINLDLLGIPSDRESCTVLLTSRDKSVFVGMRVEYIFELETLTDEESLYLFKENAGSSLDDSEIESIGRKIVDECKGLPLALVAVARALRNEFNISSWLYALTQLRNCDPEDMPIVVTGVYTPLKFGYDFLKNESAKKVWFLCASFPEDCNINLNQLAYYSFGLRLFGQWGNIEETRIKINHMIKILKSRFLVLDSDKVDCVRMHDLVRDTAMYVASIEGHPIFHLRSIDQLSLEVPQIAAECTVLFYDPKYDRDLAAFQEDGDITFPTRLNFPRLQFLWMNCRNTKEIDNSLRDFFKGMKGVKVVYLQEFLFSSLPKTLQLLKNLHTLHLVGCENLKALSAVAEIALLEVLICNECPSVEELSTEIGKLSRLRVLDFTCCRHLCRIEPHIISKLVRLEVFRMLQSFTGWGIKEKEQRIRNASLKELESLVRLTCLEINVSDWKLLEMDMHLSSNIQEYNIHVGKNLFFYEGRHKTLKTVCINLPRKAVVCFGNWIKDFSRRAKCLLFFRGGCKSLDLIDGNFSHDLQHLEIANCYQMENVLSMEVEEKVIIFPELKRLLLHNLPKLERFCKRNNDVDLRFPKLEYLDITWCPELNQLVDMPPDENRSIHPHLFCNKKVTHGSLKELSIKGCKRDSGDFWCHDIPNPIFFGLETIHLATCRNFKDLFSYSVVENLANLKFLKIVSCSELIYVIADDTKTHGCKLMFPKLEVVVLNDLPKF